MISEFFEERPLARLIFHIVILVVTLLIVVPIANEMGMAEGESIGIMNITACVGMFCVAFAADFIATWYGENFFATIGYWIFLVVGLIAMGIATVGLAITSVNFFGFDGTFLDVVEQAGVWKTAAYVMGQSFGLWTLSFLFKAYDDDEPKYLTLGPLLAVLASYVSYLILIAIAKAVPFVSLIVAIGSCIIALGTIVMGIRSVKAMFLSLFL